MISQHGGQYLSNITSSSMIAVSNTVLEASTGIAPTEVEHDVDEIEATTTLASELIEPSVIADSSISASSSATDAPNVVELVATEEIPHHYL